MTTYRSRFASRRRLRTSRPTAASAFCRATATERVSASSIRSRSRFADPGSHVLIARIPRGALSPGTYRLRADAQVARHDEPTTSVIARDAGAVRISGDQPDPGGPQEPPITHWDGHTLRRAEAEWSIG